ncbi:MAG: substrate-binding domain-containing protein [Clostridia bacterium]|nr:substrate-binding domain-containing protein [Clostridia bacterium]
MSAFFTYTAGYITCTVLAKKEIKLRHCIVPVVLSVAAVAVSIFSYANRPEVRYAGHGFDFMHGYSSTDFTDYTVYAEGSKLVSPDTPSSFMIENENDMPVMDGAEACYPLYSSIAKSVYKDIEKIERDFKDSNPNSYVNGKIVTFTNTLTGFDRLICGDADLFFGARASKDQLEDASRKSVELEITKIGKEAFIFFVEDSNPVDGLTSEQLRAIYHGDIENWSKVGGDDEDIVAFQRPKNSGSQTMMEYFMGDVALKEPKTYETVGGMGGVIREVAQYANEDGAIGYSFRYFVEELSQEKGVKLLNIDGIPPTVENIENGTYPLTVDLCLITRKNDPNPYVSKMIEFVLSDSGQEIIRKTGYGGLSK